jgi:DNA-binding transcriptional regulator/RsmH inhibitor MraZ
MDSVARWNTAVDYKWRLAIPSQLLKKIGEKVMIFEKQDGCIEIYPSVTDLSFPFVHQVKSGGRILIPQSMRNSTSFYFGKKVTIVAKHNGAIELHPRK